MPEAVRIAFPIALVVFLLAYRFGFLEVWAPRFNAAVTILLGGLAIAVAISPTRWTEKQYSFAGELSGHPQYLRDHYDFTLTDRSAFVHLTMNAAAPLPFLENATSLDRFRVEYGGRTRKYPATFPQVHELKQIDGAHPGWDFNPPVYPFDAGGWCVRLFCFALGSLLLWFGRRKWVEETERLELNARYTNAAG
jgi:hypothetical protein